jgi:hypothetical protein
MTIGIGVLASETELRPDHLILMADTKDSFTARPHTAPFEQMNKAGNAITIGSGNSPWDPRLAEPDPKKKPS